MKEYNFEYFIYLLQLETNHKCNHPQEIFSAMVVVKNTKLHIGSLEGYAKKMYAFINVRTRHNSFRTSLRLSLHSYLAKMGEVMNWKNDSRFAEFHVVRHRPSHQDGVGAVEEQQHRLTHQSRCEITPQFVL